jgi:large subunit ribosomal protein L6
MSRLAKKPIAIPDKVTVTVAGQTVTVKGAKTQLAFTARPEVKIAYDAAAKVVNIGRTGDDKTAKAYQGTTWALIRNMVKGVTEGFKRELEVNGVGWTAVVQGRNLVLSVGYADKRIVAIPTGVEVSVGGNRIVVTGADRQLVGQFAAQTRSQRKPEPYNGKGIKYVEEVLIRKEGKAFAGTAGGK